MSAGSHPSPESSLEEPAGHEAGADAEPGRDTSLQGAAAELQQLLPWLERVARDPEQLVGLEPELLERLRIVAGRLAYPDREARRAFINARRRAFKRKRRGHDDALLDATSNRALKRSLRFPVAPPELEISERQRQLLEQQAARPEPPSADAHRLREPRVCYICKCEYLDLHHHYDGLCAHCAELNWAKRSQTADLSGRVALVTGARVKIGYQAGLMLLRAGASVVATTRFPCDSARRFAGEADFDVWRERLHIYGVDLRHTPSVERLAVHLNGDLERLDFLIHNACQTVRRPPAYFDHLVERERPGDLSAAERGLLCKHEQLVGNVSGSVHGELPQPEVDGCEALTPGETSDACRGLVNSADMSQLDLLCEADQGHLFPQGMHDGDGQQLDLRTGNSWRMQLAEVPTAELIEVQLVNAIAPFVLTSRLKPLMMKVESEDKHVVNVSAMEGQFYRSCKTTRHPHTNMAKAALNMMTRTSAADFARDGIHMNSVDTGWVTDEDPFEQAVRKEGEQRFAPPLDEVDGAARVLDPIFNGFNTGVHCWGQFLKDYRPTRW